MFKFKTNYAIILAITILTSVFGRYFTRSGMDWYQTIMLPNFVPPKWVFGVVWQAIFILTTIAALGVYNNFTKKQNRSFILALFGINAILNPLWSYLFFYNHMIGYSVACAAILTAVVYVKLFLIYKTSPKVAYLLVPYAVWGTFAVYMNYVIWYMNS